MQDGSDRLELTAPLTGVLVPLEQVPDPSRTYTDEHLDEL